MTCYSPNLPASDQYELDAIEMFGEYLWVERQEAIASLQVLNPLPPVAQRLREYEQQLALEQEYDFYGDYLSDICSMWVEEEESKITTQTSP